MKKTKLLFVSLFVILFFNNTLFSKTDYFSQGKKLFLEKNFDKSKLKFEKDIVFNPKNEKSYLYLAKIFKEKKNDKFEEQNLNTVILLNPKNEEALYLLTLLKIKQSDYQKTVKLIETFKKVCTSFCKKESELNKKLKNLEPQ